MTEAPIQQRVLFCDKLEKIIRKTSENKHKTRDHGTIKVMLSDTSKHPFVNVSHYQTGRSVLKAYIYGATKVGLHNEDNKVVVANLVDQANYKVRAIYYETTTSSICCKVSSLFYFQDLVRVFFLYFKTADSAARFVEIVSKESAVDRDRAEWTAFVKRQGVTDTIIEVASDSDDSGDGVADGDRKVAHANDNDSGKCADDDVWDDDDDAVPPVDLGSIFETQEWPEYCPKSYF
jgi:hypothetical protein